MTDGTVLNKISNQKKIFIQEYTEVKLISFKKVYQTLNLITESVITAGYINHSIINSFII